jgi:ribosomal protein S27AE
MKTVFCPDCGAALKILYKQESFSDWKFCQKCGEPSYVMADELDRILVKSLKQIIAESPSKQNLVKALEFLLKNGQCHIEDIVFVAGKASEKEIIKLYDMKALDKFGYAYSIKNVLENAVEKDIMPYLEKPKDMLEEFIE